MYIPVEIKFKSYLPLHIEKGTMFLIGVLDYKYLYKIDVSVKDVDKDTVLKSLGAPVEFSICDDEGNEIAAHHEVGWFDEDPDVKELRPITIEDINTILKDYDGLAELRIVDYHFTHDSSIVPVFVSEKIVLKLLSQEYFEDNDSEDDTINNLYTMGIDPFDLDELTKNIE